MKEANEIWAESAKTLEHVPAEMELQRVGILKEDLFALVLRFRGKKENDFMDIYYAASPGEITEPLSPSAETGKLGKVLLNWRKTSAMFLSAILVKAIRHGGLAITGWYLSSAAGRRNNSRKYWKIWQGKIRFSSSPQQQQKKKRCCTSWK